LAYAAGNECVRAHPGGVLAPRVRPLPVLVHQPAGGGDDGWALGVAESDLAEVRLDLLSPGEPFVVVGAPGSGRTTVLRRAVRHLAGTGPGVAGVLVLDPTRSLLDVADLVGRDRHASDHDSAAALVARVAAD